jgi:hypothetical protein
VKGSYATADQVAASDGIGDMFFDHIDYVL